MPITQARMISLIAAGDHILSALTHVGEIIQTQSSLLRSGQTTPAAFAEFIEITLSHPINFVPANHLATLVIERRHYEREASRNRSRAIRDTAARRARGIPPIQRSKTFRDLYDTSTPFHTTERTQTPPSRFPEADRLADQIIAEQEAAAATEATRRQLIKEANAPDFDDDDLALS